MEKFEGVRENLDLDFYSIELDENGNKQIHIHGYSYEGDDLWSIVDAVGAIMPLDEFIKRFKEQGSDFVYTGFVSRHSNYIKSGINSMRLAEIANTYFNGNPADYILPYKEITMDTPIGNYCCEC